MMSIRISVGIITGMLFLGPSCPVHSQTGPGPIARGETPGATAAVPVPAGDPFTRGVAYTGRGEIERSIEEFQKAAHLNPANPAAHLNLGILYGSAGRLDEALAEFDRVIAIDPGSAEAQFDRGIVLMRKGEYGEAASAFEKSMILGGGNLVAHYNLGICYEYAGGLRYGPGFDARKSLYHYGKVLEKRPDVAAVYYNMGMVNLRAGDPGAAEKEFKRAGELQPDMADAFFQLGLISLRRGAFQGALRNLLRAQRLDSRLSLARPLADAYGGLGKFYLDNGDFGEAQKNLQLALEQMPADAGLLVMIGRAYNGLGRNAEAIHSYTKALVADPGLSLDGEIAAAYASWGDALASEGLCERAVTEYENAIMADPAEGGYYEKLGRLYDEGYEDRGKAVYYYREALAHGLSGPRADEIKKSIANAVRNDDAILEKYRNIVARYPDNPTVHYNFGVIYQVRGKTDPAIEEYNRAVRLDPGNCFAHYNLGLAYETKEMRSSAIREYKAALRCDPGYAGANYALGRLYEELGAYREARKEYERALELFPDSAEAHLALGLLIKNRGGDKKTADEHLERYRKLKKIQSPL